MQVIQAQITLFVSNRVFFSNLEPACLMSVRVDVPNMIIITPAVLSKSSTGCLDRSIPFEERWLMKKG